MTKKEEKKSKSKGGKNPPLKKEKKAVPKTAKKTTSKRPKKTKSKKTAISSLNWKKLKVEYMASDIYIVNDFLRAKDIIGESPNVSGSIKKHTTSWRPEKRKMLEERADMQAEINRELMEMETRHLTSTAAQKKAQILNIIQERLLEYKKKSGFGNYIISNKDLIGMLNVVKTELGEPTTITKNENHNVDVNDLLNQINKVDEPVSEKDIERELYGDREILTVEVDGREC